jgi:hypothetical protein
VLASLVGTTRNYCSGRLLDTIAGPNGRAENMRWISKAGDLRVGVVLRSVITCLVWAGTLVGTFLAWAKLCYPTSQWPLPGGYVAAVWNQIWWFTALMVFALATLLNPAKRRPGRSDADAEYARSTNLEHALLRLRTHLGIPKLGYLSEREMILRAAVYEVESTLDVANRHLIQANMLVAEPPSTVSVVARSKPGAICPKQHRHEPRLMVCRAVRDNATVVECHVRRLEGFSDKPYQCVAGTPIAEGPRCYGAISIDSKDPDTFKGKEAVIDRILRPHCAALLLTLDKKALYYECPERNPR